MAITIPASFPAVPLSIFCWISSACSQASSPQTSKNAFKFMRASMFWRYCETTFFNETDFEESSDWTSFNEWNTIGNRCYLFSILSVSDGVEEEPSPLLASLNSFIPFPRPRINSGIFLPPKRRRTTARIKTISIVPNLPINLFFSCTNIRQTKGYSVLGQTKLVFGNEVFEIAL